jgi:hypothetical protein
VDTEEDPRKADEPSYIGESRNEERPREIGETERQREEECRGVAGKCTPLGRAIDATPTLPPKLREDCIKLGRQLDEVNTALNGDWVWRATNEGVPASISDHVQAAAAGLEEITRIGRRGYF